MPVYVVHPSQPATAHNERSATSSSDSGQWAHGGMMLCSRDNMQQFPSAGYSIVHKVLWQSHCRARTCMISQL